MSRGPDVIWASPDGYYCGTKPPDRFHESIEYRNADTVKKEIRRLSDYTGTLMGEVEALSAEVTLLQTELEASRNSYVHWREQAMKARNETAIAKASAVYWEEKANTPRRDTIVPPIRRLAEDSPGDEYSYNREVGDYVRLKECVLVHDVTAGGFYTWDNVWHPNSCIAEIYGKTPPVKKRITHILQTALHYLQFTLR